MDFLSWGAWVATAIQIAAVWFAMTYPEHKSWGWVFFSISLIILFLSSASFLNKKFNPDDAGGIQIWVIGLCFLATGFALAKLTTSTLSPIVEAKEIRTIARLQFFGDDRLPTELHQENVFSWFAFHNDIMGISQEDVVSGKITPHLMGRTWNISLIFDKPISYRELTLTFSASGFPKYQIYQPSVQGAFIWVAADIPPGTLEITAKY